MGARRNLLTCEESTEFQFLVVTDPYKEGTEELLWPVAVIGCIGTKHTAGTVLLLFSVVNNSSIFRFSEKSIFNIFLPFLPHKLIVLLVSLVCHWLAVTLLVAPAGGSFLCEG